MKAEIQEYLMNTFGHQYDNLELDMCASANPFIRFDLGGEDNNEKKERVVQAATRASTLWEEIFPDKEAQITVLAYDYLYADEYTKPQGILRKFLPKESFEELYNAVETRIVSDEDEDDRVRVIIGNIHVKDIDAPALFRSIANTEMDFSPALFARMFFIDQSRNILFYMYDDRGCVVEAQSATQLQPLYEARKSWILEDYEEKMERYFQGEA